MKRKITVGTRASGLAIRQAEEVATALKQAHPGVEIALVPVHSLGDKDKVSPISRFGSKGIFVAELEDQLRAGRVDVAVHSLKDMPSEDPPGFAIAAVPPRLDPRDVLVSSSGHTLHDLPSGSRIGTGSPRRAVQIQAARPDLKISGIRGNIDTRIRKMRDGQYDAIVLAAAGLIRMGWQDQITEFLSTEVCLPAAGQGALAVETLDKDDETTKLVAEIQNGPTRSTVNAERSLLKHMGGGCLAPITAYAWLENDKLVLTGMVGNPQTNEILRDTVRGTIGDPEGLGAELAEILNSRGAAKLLEAVER